jgi:hypothetical protein
MPNAPANREDLKRDVAAALRELERRLEAFIEALSHDVTLAAAEGAPTTREALRRICEAYAAIDYAQDDAVNESPTCLGVVGATAPTLARAEAVNTAKAALRAVCAPLQDLRVRIAMKDGQGGQVVKPHPLVRVILRDIGRSDLNLLSAYRKIPVLTGRAARVAYLRALTRAVYRKDRDTLAAMVAATGRLGVEEDLRRLRALPARETHLALVRERYTNVRANVWFDGLDSRNRGRVMVAAELPLLYLAGRTKELPEIRYPTDEEGADTLKRQRTGKLEAEPFLDSLPVYRYRPAARPGQPRR